MTYAVLVQNNADWVAIRFPASNMLSAAHMSSADTLAHAKFKEGYSVRVVNNADHAQVFYTLTRETHTVDDTGKVRAINPTASVKRVHDAVPEGAKATGIDMTPTWSGMLPYLILAFTNGNSEAQKIATEELKNMAKAADQWNASIR